MEYNTKTLNKTIELISSTTDLKELKDLYYTCCICIENIILNSHESNNEIESYLYDKINLVVNFNVLRIAKHYIDSLDCNSDKVALIEDCIISLLGKDTTLERSILETIKRQYS